MLFRSILEGIVSRYEEHHRVTIKKEAIVAAVRLSSRYINDRRLPDKAIDLIDEASSAARLKIMKTPEKLYELEAQIKELDIKIERSIRFEVYLQASEQKKEQDELVKKYNRLKEKVERERMEKSYVVTEEDIAAVTSMWTKIPLQKLEEKESEKLLKLESILHKRVIGQEEAVTAVSRAMRRGREIGRAHV